MVVARQLDVGPIKRLIDEGVDLGDSAVWKTGFPNQEDGSLELDRAFDSVVEDSANHNGYEDVLDRKEEQDSLQ